MGLRTVFEKIGKGIVLDALKTGKVLRNAGDILGAKSVMVMVPVSGSILTMVAVLCGRADKLFPEEPGSKRKEWVRAQIRKDLRKRGHEERYIDELVAVAFLVNRGVVGVIEVPEPKPRGAFVPRSDKKPEPKDEPKDKDKDKDQKKDEPKIS